MPLTTNKLPLRALLYATLFLTIALVTWNAIFDKGYGNSVESYNRSEKSGPPKKVAGYIYSAKRTNLTKAVDTQKKLTQALSQRRQYFAENATDLEWQSVGPYNIGGRTRALVFSPNDSNVIYTAGVSGGVFKSVDSGQQWQPVSDDLENLAVVTLAILPDQPDTIFAGTGEGQYVGRPVTRSRGVEGNGIFISSDGGDTWQSLSFTLNNPDFRFVNKLRVGGNNQLFAATETGIWRSADLGSSWEVVLDQDFRVGGCLEVEIKPDDPEVILASCGSFEDSAMYQSTDNGDNWQEVLTAPDMGRTVITFAPSQPSTVYALAAQNQFGQRPYAVQGLYRSLDSGGSWTLISDSNSANPINQILLSNAPFALQCPDNVLNPSRIFGQGWFDIVLRVDPVDPERLWAGGVDLFRSDDGGVNFNMVSFWQASPAFGGNGAASYVHADQHQIIFHPDYDAVTETRVYAINDGGVFVTSNPNAEVASNPCDATSTAIAWTALNQNYAVNQFYHGSVSTDGTVLLGGMQDNGTYISRQGEAWQKVQGGDGAYSAQDPNDPDTLYVSSQFAALSRIALAADIEESQETFIDGGIQENRPFITPYLLDSNNANRLFLAASSLWRSDNRGDDWQQISVPHYDNVVLDWLSALAVKPGDANDVLVGSSDGYIYRHDSALSADGSFTMPNTKISDGFVSSVNFAPFETDIAYATVSTFGESHIYYSQNAGVDWVVIDGSGEGAFPDIPAHDVIKAPEDNTTLYVGSDLGVYKSEDNGELWLPFGAGLPNTPVEKLVLIRHNLESSLFAFTYGRGAFRLMLTDVVNLPPTQVINSLFARIDTGDQFSVDLNPGFNDRNQDPVLFVSAGLPDGLSLTQSGILSGQYDQAGTYEIPLEATDGELSTAFVVTITVNEPPAPPVIPVPTPPASTSSGGGMSWMLLLMFSILIVKRVQMRP